MDSFCPFSRIPGKNTEFEKQRIFLLSYKIISYIINKKGKAVSKHRLCKDRFPIPKEEV